MFPTYYLTQQEYANYVQGLSTLSNFVVQPQILMRYGRQNEPIRVPITDLLIDTEVTYTEQATTLVSMTVANAEGFSVNDYILVGPQYGETSEITQITAISGTDFTVALSRVHPTSTQISLLRYNQVEISNSPSPAGTKTVMTTANLQADQDFVFMPTITSGYYFARYYNYSTNVYSDYSDALPYIGYNKNMARAIIDNALMSINKDINDNLTDEYCFVQLNNCIEEVSKAAKRYSFYQKNRYPIRAVYGEVSYDAPSDLDNSQAYFLEYTRQLTYLDNRDFAQYVPRRATLTAPVGVGAGTVFVDDSNDFPSRLDITPSVPTVTVVGISGITQYTYAIEVNTVRGWSRLSSKQIVTGNAVPSALNYNNVTWDEYPGATDYRLYRTEGGVDQGLLYQGTALTYSDIGSAVLSPIETVQAIGSIFIGGVALPYIENENNIFTLQYTSSISALTGQDVLEYSSIGTPSYYTIQGDSLLVYPAPNTEKNMYLTYYTSSVYINKDQDTIPFDNTMLAVYYLEWKLLVKQNNGMDTKDSEAKRALYEKQLMLLRTKDRNGITKLAPVLRDWKY